MTSLSISPKITHTKRDLRVGTSIVEFGEHVEFACAAFVACEIGEHACGTVYENDECVCECDVCLLVVVVRIVFVLLLLVLVLLVLVLLLLVLVLLLLVLVL